MSKYDRIFTASFGESKKSIDTVGYTIYDSDNNIIIPRTLHGVTEVGGGSYVIHALIDFGFIGYIKWDTGEDNPAYAVEEINDISGQVWNNPDRKLSNQKSCNIPPSDPEWTSLPSKIDTSIIPSAQTKNWPTSIENTNKIPKPPSKW